MEQRGECGPPRQRGFHYANLMPRKKSFPTTEPALTKALELFRERGYSATVMGEIAQHLGVSRGTLYATFGDKRSLFLQALRQDAQKHRTARFAGPGCGCRASPGDYRPLRATSRSR